MKIIRLSYTTDQNRKKIDGVEKDLKDLKADFRKIKSEVNKLSKAIDSLNIGQRRFWQQKTVFTSLQRKIERFEKVEKEWEKYKSSIDTKIKREVEKNYRARIQKPTSS